jgi:hypothetical protein
MEIVLTLGLFACAMFGLGVGVIFSRKGIRGSCGSDPVVGPDGRELSCGACPRREVDVCPSEDNLVRLAQIAHPNPNHHR